MKEMLEERKLNKSEWTDNFENWININKCFYNLRNRLEKLGYNILQPFPNENIPFLTKRRERIIASVKDICDNWYGHGKGIKRTELGIYTGERSTFAFNGKKYLVGVNDIEDLAELGTDIMLVEKPEVVDKLASFTKDVGVALLTCSGNYVEYATQLCDMAHDYGCNTFLLGDLDIPAIAMALRIPYAKHIGLDLNTLRTLNMNAIDVDEPYDPSDNQLKFVEDKLRFYKGLQENGEISSLVASGDYIIGGEGADFDEREYNDKSNIIHYNVPLLRKLVNNSDYWDYMKHRRIEIDLLIEHDDFDPKEFWNDLCSRMLSFYQIRDYNRAIQLPDAFKCPIIVEQTDKLYSVAQPIIKPTLDKQSNELESFQGFTDVNKKYQELVNGCNITLKSNSLVMELIRDLNKVWKKRKYKSLFTSEPAA